MPMASEGGVPLAHTCEGKGPRILFVQGSGLPGAGWSPQVEALKDRFACASFDHRGTGASGPVGSDLSFDDLTSDTLRVMDALGWEDAHVVGHSIGGVIATGVALAAKRRVKSLTLMCTFVRGNEASRMSPWIVWTGLRTMVGTRRMRRHAFLEMVLSPSELAAEELDTVAERMRPLFGRDLGDPSKTAFRQLGATAKSDLSSRLAEVEAPTLVMSAAHDRIALPSYGARLAELVPRARFELFADAAHGLPITRADAVNAMLAAHVDAVERGAPS